jgi:hypothetical protein
MLTGVIHDSNEGLSQAQFLVVWLFHAPEKLSVILADRHSRVIIAGFPYNSGLPSLCGCEHGQDTALVAPSL